MENNRFVKIKIVYAQHKCTWRDYVLLYLYTYIYLYKSAKNALIIERPPQTFTFSCILVDVCNFCEKLY